MKQFKPIYLLALSFLFLSGCAGSIYTEGKGRGSLISESEQTLPEEEIPGSETGPINAMNFIGSCYLTDKNNDEYCINIEAVETLNPDEISSLTRYAKEYCLDEFKAELVSERCVDLNNSMNDFKEVVDNMDPKKLCMDKRELESFEIATFHILADDKGSVKLDKDDAVCERKKK